MFRSFLNSQKKFTRSNQSGFTLAEVLVSILVTGSFAAAAMSTLVVGAYLQADSRIYSEASNWIQEDLEQVKIVAYDRCQTPFALRKTTAQVTNSTTINLAYLVSGEVSYSDSTAPSGCSFSSTTSGFRVGDAVLIGSNVQRTVSAISGTQLTLNSAITASSGTYVYARCRAQTTTTGFAAYLQSLLPTLVNNGTKTVSGKTLTLTRTTTIRNQFPFAILELEYTVRNPANQIVAQLSTEVVPNAFYRCP